MKKALLVIGFLAIIAAPSPFDPHSARLLDGEPIVIDATALPTAGTERSGRNTAM